MLTTSLPQINGNSNRYFMAYSTPTVFVVDDDSSVRRSLARLLRSATYQAETFASAEDFFASGKQQRSPACLVLDVQLPGLTGLDLQDQLRAANSTLPIIFITGHGDIPMSVRAMKDGAVDFLPKPFQDEQLLQAIARAIDKNTHDQQKRGEIQSIQQRIDTLTSREREVMELVVTGKLNKHIASELGIVEKTVKVHRGRVIKKMKVDSLAALVHLADKAGFYNESGESNHK